MLQNIITFLNLKLELLNYFDLTRCLCEIKTDSEGKAAPKEYISAGNFDDINFDEFNGVSYWRLRDEITTSPLDSVYKAGKRIQTTVPLKLVFSVPREKLTADDAYSYDRIRQTIVKQFNIDDGALKTSLGAEKILISSPTANGDPRDVWDNETENTGTFEPKYEVVFGSVDIDVVITSKGECLPTECDDVDSDILHTFDFCSALVRDRLTAAQVICLETAYGGVCDPVTEQINGVTIGTVASGGTNNQVIENTASNPIGSNANPSVIPNSPVFVNGSQIGSIPATKDVLLTVQNTALTQVGTSANPSVVSDSAITNSDSSYSVSVVAQGSLSIPDTDIQVNGAALISQPSTITKDVVVKYANGTPIGTITAGEVVVDNPVVCDPVTVKNNAVTVGTPASGTTFLTTTKDSAGADVGTDAQDSVVADSTNQVNGVDISDPTVAEGTHNQAIQNSAATPVGTAANPSVIGDSQAQVNGVNTETIAATVTHNQQIQDSAGGSVGTAANPSVISDNTINFNGADVDTVKAEESYPFLVKLDGTNSGTYNAGTNTVSVVSAVCADATTQVNAVNVGTVASGGTFDQQIHDSAGADVGTAANPSVISDSAITVSGSALTTLKATQSLAIDVIDTDSNPVTATIIDADTIQVPAGSSPPVDPSSFSDANALFLGDRGLTFVDSELDTWENQGSDGTDASAVSTSGRIGASSGLGVGSYRNFQPWNKVNFRAGGFNTSAMAAFTFEGITTAWNNWNPNRITTSLGNINSSNIAALVWVGSQGFRLQFETGGSASTIYWNRANIGIDKGESYAWSIVYDGSQATNADRMKLYVNGVLKSQSTTPTIPTTLTNDGSVQITSTHTNYSSYAEIGGYLGYWERALSGAELAANQTWREQMWAVTP